jgi:hypothetical protein
VGGTSLAVLLLGVGFVAGRYTGRPAVPTAAQTPVAAADLDVGQPELPPDVAPPEEKPADADPVTEPVVAALAKEGQPAGSTAGADKGPPEDDDGGVGKPGPVPAEVAQPVPVAPGKQQIDIRGDNSYRIYALLGQTELTLRGKVKTLRVGAIDGKAVLDASGLEAEEVLFEGRIGGGSTVKVNAPGGRVQFKSKVEGGSRVEVHAPDGSVSFRLPTSAVKDGSKIDGDSQVNVTARDAYFRGMVNGPATQVQVTLTKGGWLRFEEVSGGARLHYRKADPEDPQPDLHPGSVHSGGEFKRID